VCCAYYALPPSSSPFPSPLATPHAELEARPIGESVRTSQEGMWEGEGIFPLKKQEY
jgi:hypothetical protein